MKPLIGLKKLCRLTRYSELKLKTDVLYEYKQFQSVLKYVFKIRFVSFK